MALASARLSPSPPPVLGVIPEHVLNEEVGRLHRTMASLFAQFREHAERIRVTPPFNVTKQMLGDWAADLTVLLTRCEDVVFDFRPMEHVRPTTQAAPTTPKRKLNISDIVTQIKSQNPVPSSAHHPTPPSSSGGPLVVQSSIAKNREKNGRPSGSGPIQHVVENTALSHAINVASAIHLLLDSTMRCVDAATATLYAPHHGATEDLRAICDVGRGPDANLDALSLRDPNCGPCLAATTGVMITVLRGIDPPSGTPCEAESVAQTAAASFQESIRLALQGSVSAEALSNSSWRTDAELSASVAAHGTTNPPTSPRDAARHRVIKSTWSSVSVPVRVHAAHKPSAILYVTNKSLGKANFDAEDEHALYGIARMLAALIQRHPDLYALVPHYNPGRPLPPTVTQTLPKVKLMVRGVPISELTGGFKSQLVWRTWDHPGHGRDVKITLGAEVQDKAVKLDERIPITRVYDYVERLQSAWQKSTLLNIEYQTAFDQRTALVTSLVQKLKVAAHKNKVLQELLRQCRSIKGLSHDGSHESQPPQHVETQDESRTSFGPPSAQRSGGGGQHRLSRQDSWNSDAAIAQLEASGDREAPVRRESQQPATESERLASRAPSDSDES